MKAGMNKDVRVIRTGNYEILRKIETEIKMRVQNEYLAETDALRKENEDLLTTEKQFYDEAEAVLNSLKYGEQIRVETQVGPGGSIVNTYVGHIESPYRNGRKMFNMISDDKLNGKPFTIGFSCLLSIEKL